MKEPAWLSEKSVREIHCRLIHRFGGEQGLLDEGRFKATLAKPINLYVYGEDVGLFDLAAAYGYGFIKNHCFIDGNKRIAVACIDVFLQKNGWELVAEEPAVVLYFLELAASSGSSEEQQNALAQWIKTHAQKLS
jgi:death-on-curing protein